jgi:hypothetical protein
MGHKGVSKRKPKTKSKPGSNVRVADLSLVQALVKDKGAPLNSAIPSTGVNKSQKKR